MVALFFGFFLILFSLLLINQHFKARLAFEKKLKTALKKGDLKFQLFGKKLTGEFVLVKLKGKEDNSWLLIKHNDEYAVDTEYNSEEQTLENSPINKWLKENKKPVKKKV